MQLNVYYTYNDVLNGRHECGELMCFACYDYSGKKSHLVNIVVKQYCQEYLDALELAHSMLKWNKHSARVRK